MIALTATIAAAALNADPNADATPAKEVHATHVSRQPDRNIDMLVQRPNHEAAFALKCELHTHSHTHICKHAHNNKRAGMYTVLCNKPKRQSNCDKRYICTFPPTVTHIHMHGPGPDRP